MYFRFIELFAFPRCILRYPAAARWDTIPDQRFASLFCTQLRGQRFHLRRLQLDKVNAVEGFLCDTIRDNSYPLCRKYSLAYSGQLTAVENDFLTYILTQGQETVSQDYIPVKKTQTFLSDKSAGEISIAGSSSAAPLVQALAKSTMATRTLWYRVLTLQVSKRLLKL